MAIIISIIVSALFAIPWAVGVTQTTYAQIKTTIDDENITFMKGTNNESRINA